MRRAIFLLVASLTVSACALVASPETEEELAPFMADLQRYSQKLGYAVGEENGRLARFYLEEIGETLETIRERVPEHDGLPIATTSTTIMTPALERMERALGGDGPGAPAAYAELVEACNRCHAATEHEFIRILPATGTPPFNQDFAP